MQGNQVLASSQHERRWCERVPVEGAAAILESGYLGVVYELVDVSLGGARLRGPMLPPGYSFGILLRASNRFWERRARQVWNDEGEMEGLGVEFQGAFAGTYLEDPEIEDTTRNSQGAAPWLNRNAKPWSNRDAASLLDLDPEVRRRMMASADGARPWSTHEFGRFDMGTGIEL